ncbi:ATP-binding protein [Bacillus cytotoxicus]|uniref:ATP-binding protein n=1 Tax=Bacillus cereus group sp. BfR-BA-01492 TaxID=2920361 RepID=UPI001F566E21|nr:ATP-binding protein [Bacillus cereus group sp. BfR-BA-01492]EMA6342860.1 ATP-binding protein [Bacillus cytotoxicus]
MVERYVILTIGKTHSGKSTFARKLEKELEHTVVIDQDEHAVFLQSVYPLLVPKEGENILKYSITERIIEYTILNTAYHMIVCNANLQEAPRTRLIQQFQKHGFKVIVVKFDLPVHIIKNRIASSQRNTAILRTVHSFEEVLYNQESIEVPKHVSGADMEFSIFDEKDAEIVIRKIRTCICCSATYGG